MLKANKNEKYKDEVFTVFGFNKINGDLTLKQAIQVLKMQISLREWALTAMQLRIWSDDQSTLFFGINTLEKKDDKKSADSLAKAKTSGAKTDTIAKAKTPAPTVEPKKDDIEKPDMIIWNWQDKRLQSAQQTQEMRDKNLSVI